MLQQLINERKEWEAARTIKEEDENGSSTTSPAGMTPDGFQNKTITNNI